MKIGINGAGIAGTTLAFWLKKFGHEPVLFELAPELRAGGYVIDFWGAGYDIAEKMGLIPKLRSLGYNVGEWRLVNVNGKRTGGFSTGVIEHLTKGRVTSLQRSDLAAAIYGCIEGEVETHFGDSVAGIEDGKNSVRVTFEKHPPMELDLIVGADGLHSRVREIVFGPESNFEKYLGYHVAAFQLKGYTPRDELVYISHSEPGRQVSRFSMRDDHTVFLFVFRDDISADEFPNTIEQRRAIIRKIFGDVGWEAPRILASMDEADDIYFDRVSQIHMDQWSLGRTVLIGDAAACVSLLAGEGSGLAMAEAYVLAGELAAAEGIHEIAFANYERLLMPFIKGKQETAKGFANSFAPATNVGIFVRDLATRLMAIPFLADYFVGRDMRDNIKLPDYADL